MMVIYKSLNITKSIYFKEENTILIQVAFPIPVPENKLDTKQGHQGNNAPK